LGAPKIDIGSTTRSGKKIQPEGRRVRILHVHGTKAILGRKVEKELPSRGPEEENFGIEKKHGDRLPQGCSREKKTLEKT